MNRRSTVVKVTYTRSVKQYLRDLIKTLYDKEYFSYEETSVKYVTSLLLEVKTTIHVRQRKKAPAYFSRYGKNLYYVCYPKSKRTTWYFFFTYHPEGNVYLIRYVSNNHVEGHWVR